jgi:hypothetical protein
MKRVLNFAAVGEAATGLALLVVPSLVGQLLLGVDLTGIAVPLARVAGIALIGLGIACWPGPPLVGMLTYSALVTASESCPALTSDHQLSFCNLFFHSGKEIASLLRLCAKDALIDHQVVHF